MSQSQAFDAIGFTFPLVKFSYNTNPRGTPSQTWTHINYRNDLDFILKDVRVVDDCGQHESRSWMKVAGSSEILESQDLAQLVKHCQEFNPSTSKEHPVDVVVKCPFLAIKYPKTLDTVRRIQVKFRKESDFVKAVSMLKNLGLPVVDKNTSTSAPVSLSPAPSLLSSTANCSSKISLPRLSTGHLSFQDAAAAASLISQVKSDFNIPMRSDSAAYGDLTLHSEMPYPNSEITRPFSTGSKSSAEMLVPSFHEATNQCLSLLPAQIESQLRTCQVPQSNLPSSTPANSNLPKHPNISVSHFKDKQEQSSSRNERTARFLNTSPLFDSQSHENAAIGAETASVFCDNHPIHFNPQRPTSTPTELMAIQDLCMPPKRELPFPKPEDKTKTLSPASMELPRLLKPTPVTNLDAIIRSASANDVRNSTQAKKPATKRRIAQRKPTMVKLPAETSFNETQAGSVVEESRPTIAAVDNEPSPLVESTVVTTRPTLGASRLQSKAAASKKRAAPARPASAGKCSKMVDQSTQTETIFDKPNKSDNPAPLESVADCLPSVTLPEDYLHHVDTFIAKHRNRPAPKELWEAPGYAEADNEVRDLLLKDFICENLQNEDFLQLCQDMSTSWHAMALGM